MTRKPKRVKMASMRSRRMVSGWRWPMRGRRPGSVMSTAPAGGRVALRGQPVRRAAPRSLPSARLASWPSRGRSSAGGLAECLEQAGDEPALAREVAVADGPEVRLGPSVPQFDLELPPEVLNDRQWRIGGHGLVRDSRGQAAHAAQSTLLNHVNLLNLTNHRQACAAGLASAAALASTANAFGLVTARSASCLRSIGLPAAFRPAMS